MGRRRAEKRRTSSQAAPATPVERQARRPKALATVAPATLHNRVAEPPGFRSSAVALSRSAESDGAAGSSAIVRGAKRHHRGGNLAEAERLYRQVLAREPENAEALHYLGLLEQQRGRSAEALELI